ncbi:MAG: LamG-like jellyroll fold domain-containing protein [Rubripirellula sp.]
MIVYDRLALVLSLGITLSLPSMFVQAQEDDRVSEGLQVLYDFSGTGKTIMDRSGVGRPLNLEIENPMAVRRGSGALHVRARASIHSNGPATKIIKSVKRSGECTIEVWLQSSTRNQEGPARIVTLSGDSVNRNFTLGQMGERFDVRFRAGSGSANGLPSTESSDVLDVEEVLNSVVHVVYTRDRAGKAKLYVNGERVGQRDVKGDLSNWSDFPLTLADEQTGERMWLGSYHLVAIYAKALKTAEVIRNYKAGHLVRSSVKLVDLENQTLDREDTGLQVVYDFQGSDKGWIRDRSGRTPPLDLSIDKPDRVQHGDGILRISGDAKILSTGSTKRLVDAIARSGAMSIETWMRPDGLEQKGPARIITLSKNSSERNFTLGQEGASLEVRLRTTETSGNGIPATLTKRKSLKQKLMHVVFTRGRTGKTRIYVDGRLSGQSSVAGVMNNWDDEFRLQIGNEFSGDRPWKGELRLVAIYSRELSPSDVAANHAAGVDGEIKQRLTATVDPRPRFFETKIAPILSQHCIECHDSASREGGLDLSRKGPALAGGDSGKAIVKSRSSESLLWQSVEEDLMPHDRPPLSADEKRVLQQWIDDGAVWSIDYVDPSIYRHVRESENWVQRLTLPEYVESVRSVFGVDISQLAGELLPLDKRADGFRNTAYNLNVDLEHVESYARLAEAIVAQVDVEAFAKRYSKSKKLTDDNMRALVSDLGKWVLRGPLNDSEVALYRGISTTVASAGGDFREAVSMILEAMLQSPRFIYRIENQVGDGTAWPVDDYELASRMSYIIWGASPDKELLSLAGSGELADPNVMRAQMDRMFEDVRAKEQSRQFVTQWLNLDRLANMRPNAERFPNWSAVIAEDMRQETIEYFMDVVWKQNRPLADLLNAQFTYLTPKLANHYGLKPQEEQRTRYDLTEVGSRGGILTHGSVLTIGGDDASMVTRGLFVLNDLLFSEVGDPPPGLDTTPVPTSPGRTHRAIATERVESTSCGGCHSRFEPLAYGLEKFDGLGAFHDLDEHGNRLREDGQILFPGEAESVGYESSAEMMDLLANSDRVKECLTRKVTQFSLGRPLYASDASTVRAIHEASQRGGGTYQSLLREIILSELVQVTRTEPFPSE